MGPITSERKGHHWYRVTCPAVWGEGWEELMYEKGEADIRRVFYPYRQLLTIEQTDLSFREGLAKMLDLPLLPESQWPDDAPRPDRAPKHPRMGEVVDWLKTYAGSNDFAKDVKFKVENGRTATGANVGGRKAYRLSDAQVEALAKVKDREEAWAKERTAPRDTGLNLWAVLPYGRVRAAAENEEGGLSFVIMDKVESGKWADWVFVRAQAGPAEWRIGSQRPDANYHGEWTTVIRNITADLPAAVARYGLELGRCGVCELPLTNEESRRLGIGPVCRTRLRAA